MVVPDPASYEFGPYRLLFHQGLFRGTDYIPLAPKEFAVLCALASRLGGIVTKEQLIAEVWPRDYVSDESIARCIYVLRRTLEQTAEGQKRVFIQTVHRRGYRIAVPVHRYDASAQTLPAPTTEQEAALDQCRLGFSRLGFCSKGDIDQAVLCFQKALELDSSCAMAYAGMGEATIIQAGRGWIDVDVARQMLRGMVEAGRMFDPNSGFVYALSSFLAGIFEWNWPQAEADSHRAVKLGGGYQASIALGTVALCQDRTAEAIPHFEDAVRVAPYIPHCHDMLVWGLLAQGDYARAHAQAQRATEMLPSITNLFQTLSVAAAYTDRHDESVTAAERAVLLSERELHTLAGLVTALHRAGRTSEARAVYDEIMTRSTTQKVIWSWIAPEVLLMEGRERCLDVLDRARDERCCILAIKMTDPRLLPMRDEPRFQAVLRTVCGRTG